MSKTAVQLRVRVDEQEFDAFAALCVHSDDNDTSARQEPHKSTYWISVTNRFFAQKTTFGSTTNVRTGGSSYSRQSESFRVKTDL